ncbi:MAG: hypothetical protein AB7V39_19575, partial [Nitrospiraceae bacterium]
PGIALVGGCGGWGGEFGNGQRPGEVVATQRGVVAGENVCRGWAGEIGKAQRPREVVAKQPGNVAGEKVCGGWVGINVKEEA